MIDKNALSNDTINNRTSSAERYVFPDNIENAISSAASFMRKVVDGHAYGVKDGTSSEQTDPNLKDPVENSTLVKKVASMFGASLTGICIPERQWFKSSDGIEEMGFFDDNIRAVVIAVAMNPDPFHGSPSMAISRATSIGYMEMAIAAGCVAEFIRGLGYRAVAYGNDCAISTPMGEKAGLGKIGRNCMLVTKEFGPCVRLSKVFTDMNLVPDKPSDLGVREFCETCNRCIEACPVGAFMNVKERKDIHQDAVVDEYWKVDGGKCRGYWREIGSSCGICITVCPYHEKT